MGLCGDKVDNYPRRCPEDATGLYSAVWWGSTPFITCIRAEPGKNRRFLDTGEHPDHPVDHVPVLCEGVAATPRQPG